MADQPQESVQHPIPDRRNPQPQQAKYLGVDRRRPLAELSGRPGGDPSAGGEPETVRQDVARERERDKERETDKGYN